MPTDARPVVFIHGLWLHATSWSPWLELFEQAGYDPIAPGWPGDADTVEESRANPDAIANKGIEDVTAHYRAIIDALPAKPILVGHSFGGMIAEKLLGENYGVAAVAIDAAQIKGVLPVPLSALHSTLPVFKNPANIHHAVSLTSEQFAFSFGNALPADESDELHDRWSIPAPGKPLFEAAVSNFSLHSPAKVDTKNNERGPLLLVMGGQDNTVPEVITKSTLKQYKHSTAATDLLEFEDRGHSLTIDHGWREVADECLTWLDKQGLVPTRVVWTRERAACVSQRELSSDEQARIVAIACGLARGGRTSELSEFVEHGLDVDSTDSEGNSLLMLAAYRGATDTVRMLLDKGADPNLLNAKNQSILAGALFKGETDIVTLLIAAGADLDIGSPTARDTAAMFKQQHLLGDA